MRWVGNSLQAKKSMWLLSPAPFKHEIRFSGLVTRSSWEEPDRAHPSSPSLSVALSLVKMGRGLPWGSGFRKERHSLCSCLLRKGRLSGCAQPGRPRRTALGGAGARRLTWSTKVRSGSTMAVTCCGEGPDSAAPRVFPGPELATRVKLEKGKLKTPTNHCKKQWESTTSQKRGRTAWAFSARTLLLLLRPGAQIQGSVLGWNPPAL